MRKKHSPMIYVALCAAFLFSFMVSSYDVKAAEPLNVDIKDGEYAIDVELVGGSGKATVNTPTLMIVKDKKAYAQLIWSSSNYDYMIIDDVRYDNLEDGEMNSTFEIPITAMDEPMTIIADTTAMGTPHEIEYQLTFFADSIDAKSNLPQEQAKKVIYIALAIIVFGGILNVYVKKKNRV
ncbi:MAG: hypothetical protein Q4E53_06840 [Eubacteriales bacterium]|nr:hypothetical protein [Eubacteriales bacterium]